MSENYSSVFFSCLFQLINSLILVYFVHNLFKKKKYRAAMYNLVLIFFKLKFFLFINHNPNFKFSIFYNLNIFNII